MWTDGRATPATLCRAVAPTLWRVALVGVTAAALTGPALAHGGSLGSAAGASPSVPPWLVTATTGATLGASLLASATAPSLGGDLRAFGLQVRSPGGRVPRALGRLLGVLVLVGVVIAGLVGPVDPLSNPATVVVWVGWWAGFAASVYLVVDSWPAVDPWRTLSRALPDVGREYEWRYGAWPSVAGLLALTWVEVVGPLAERPRALAVTVLAYTAVTLAGAAVYGTGTWFGTVDPIAGVFRRLGHVAPVTTAGSGRLTVRFPGAALGEAGLVSGRDDAAFVVALLWVFTYDGLVTTPLWGDVVTDVVRTGVPPGVVYPLGLCLGFGLCLGGYLAAVGVADRVGPTALDAETLTGRFAPPLLAVAAAAHLAHFLGYFLALTPPLLAAVTSPLDPVAAPVLVLPDAVGAVAVGGVLAGHVLALRAVRVVAVELCPDRPTAVRIAIPVVAATTVYTLVTLWVVTRPSVAPPFL